MAAASFALATVAPILYVQRVHGLSGRVATTPLEMVLQQGVYGRELRSTILIALPGAALGLLSFLWSRRTRAVMVATRPLVLVVSVLPAFAVLLPVLKLAKHQRFDYSLGPAMGLVALGAVFGVLGALRFGRGVPDPDPRRRRDEDDGD